MPATGLKPTKEPTPMRYRETGEVHLNFHRTTNGTIAYLRQTYGQDVLDETFRRTAHDVYRSMREDLLQGDYRQLVEHWRYYFDREGGSYSIDDDGAQVRMTVTRCPAIAHLESEGIPVDPAFCRQTVVINSALAEGSPFEIKTEVLGGGRCVQTIRRRP